jgi:hypothetical protein
MTGKLITAGEIQPGDDVFLKTSESGFLHLGVVLEARRRRKTIMLHFEDGAQMRFRLGIVVYVERGRVEQPLFLTAQMVRRIRLDDPAMYRSLNWRTKRMEAAASPKLTILAFCLYLAFVPHSFPNDWFTPDDIPQAYRGGILTYSSESGWSLSEHWREVFTGRFGQPNRAEVLTSTVIAASFEQIITTFVDEFDSELWRRNRRNGK